MTYRLLGVNRDLPVKWHGTINLFVSGRARDLFRECGPWDVRGTINTYSLLYNDSLMFIHLISLLHFRTLIPYAMITMFWYQNLIPSMLASYLLPPGSRRFVGARRRWWRRLRLPSRGPGAVRPPAGDE